MATQTDDPGWESFVRDAVSHLITSLPNIIRNGYQGDGVSIPSYKEIALPDLSGFDTKQQPSLCPILYHQASTAKLSVTNAKVTGLDTIAAYGDMSFPVPNIKLVVPAIFSAIAVSGNWTTSMLCQKGSSDPIETVHDGTFVLRLDAVQATLAVALDADGGAVTDLTITLTDNNTQWGLQPTFDPATDLTFDAKTTTGQKTVLASLLQSDDVRAQLRDLVKTNVIENRALANDIKKVINNLLQKLLG